MVPTRLMGYCSTDGVTGSGGGLLLLPLSPVVCSRKHAWLAPLEID